jgi:4,5-DOPA dioxygenase extradiol
MPVLFIGHGNPMNAIADNEFTRSLRASGKNLPRPEAICVISAHWLTDGTFVSVTGKPETIHDFYGFPEELFRMTYPANGAPAFADKLSGQSALIKKDASWGLDHGAWSILVHLFPEADIPVFQLSIDILKPMRYHYDLARSLSSLRNEGILFIGSGNIVHNLSLVNFDDDAEPFDWAVEFDTFVDDKLSRRDDEALIEWERVGKAAKLSVPTTDHYIPLLYTIGFSDESEKPETIYEGIELSSMSMRSIRIG